MSVPEALASTVLGEEERAQWQFFSSLLPTGSILLFLQQEVQFEVQIQYYSVVLLFNLIYLQEYIVKAEKII